MCARHQVSQPMKPLLAGATTTGTAAATGRYFTEYPEGLDLFGVSFNTSIGRTGISWQGEVSLKNGVPLQVDDVELLFAALSSLAPQFGASNQVGNYLGQYGREVTGYRRHQVWSAQSTLTKVFGPTLGSQQLTLLGEVGGVGGTGGQQRGGHGRAKGSHSISSRLGPPDCVGPRRGHPPLPC